MPSAGTPYSTATGMSMAPALRSSAWLRRYRSMPRAYLEGLVAAHHHETSQRGVRGLFLGVGLTTMVFVAVVAPPAESACVTVTVYVPARR